MPAQLQNHAEDPLLSVVQSRPLEALKFLKRATLLGSAFGILISIPACIFLPMYWTHCGRCNRPLHYWVVVFCALQMMQVPMRLMIYVQVQRQCEDFQQHFRQLTHSAMWQYSKRISIASYGWFVLGAVWLLNSTFCEPCPGIYRLCLGIILASVGRLIATLLLFYRSFQSVEEEDSQMSPVPKGAEQALIDLIPLERGCSCSSGADAESCAVCLNDFEDGDVMRRLPCGHAFHCACVDNWLKRNKACPLCRQDVEELMKEQQVQACAQSESTLSSRQRARTSKAYVPHRT